MLAASLRSELQYLLESTEAAMQELLLNPDELWCRITGSGLSQKLDRVCGESVETDAAEHT